jgi:hypothetical protein
VQTSYPRTMGVAIPGQISDLSNTRSGSFRNDEASAEIPFGTMVASSGIHADGVRGAEQVDATDDALVGVVVRDHAYDIPNELGDTGLKPKVVMTVLEDGRIWVITEEAITDLEAPVRVRAVAAGAEVLGAFRSTADSTDCIDVSAFCKWVSPSQTSNGLLVAEVEVHMGSAKQAVADV